MEEHSDIKAVIVKKDEQGYGLTLEGENPVFVKKITDGGPAYMAGIRENYIIIKVNGTPVKEMNHNKVVELIKSAGSYVTLTVSPNTCRKMPGLGSLGQPNGSRHSQGPSERVTAPLPVNPDVRLFMDNCKLRTLQAMRENAASELEKLGKKFDKSQNPRDKKNYEKGEHRLREIENQIKSFGQCCPPPPPFGNRISSMHMPLRNYNPHGVVYGSEFEGPPRLPPRNGRQSQFIHGSEVNLDIMEYNRVLAYAPAFNEFGPYNPDYANGRGSTGRYFQNNFHIGPNHGYNCAQTHHRAKSSPDPVSMQKALEAEESKRSDSISDLSGKGNSRSRTSAAWDAIDLGLGGSNSTMSVPGSPPPPYGTSTDTDSHSSRDCHKGGNEEHNGLVNLPGSDFPSNFNPSDVMSMEEDEGACLSESIPASFRKLGPYSNLSKLLEKDHHAHLAIFVTYLINNRLDPSCLLFHVISSIYMEEDRKEMKKWAYEIHSTFTAPGAPLHIPHVDESISVEIDDVLLKESDKDEIMRTIFRKARNKAKDEINKQLEKFKKQRTAGLGSISGPPDAQLDDSIADRHRQFRIIEEYLLPPLETYHDEWEKSQDDRLYAIITAVTTILVKHFGMEHKTQGTVLEKFPYHLSKEKSLNKYKFMNKTRKISPHVSKHGHSFEALCYHFYTECNICSKLLWGISPQGYRCSVCSINVHRGCLEEVSENCVASLQQKKDKQPSNLKKKIKDKIRPDRRNSNWTGRGRISDESHQPVENDQGGSAGGNSGLKNDKRPDTLSEELFSNDGSPIEPEDVARIPPEPKRQSNAVGRSESCKERVQKKQMRERRKHSDPNLTSKSSDVDLENRLSDANNSGSSSNSNISQRSTDSPIHLSDSGVSNNYPLFPNRNHDATHHTGANSDGYKRNHGLENDSDIEVEQETPDWTSALSEEALKKLSDSEKKAQEVLNELYHTEKSHVRNLKLMNRLFLQPMRQGQLLSLEIMNLLFCNLEEMQRLHERFRSSLKIKREGTLFSDIGPVLLEMFDGDNGEHFKKTAANFCSGQQIGLEYLKDRRKKDSKLHAFLTEAEADPLCRRLGIKDMIPMAMQRLTKYPLLFENLSKYVNSGTDEYKNIQRASELSREVLHHVNAAKKDLEDRRRLAELQRRLDKSHLDRTDKGSQTYNELKNFDFTHHRLLFEGPLSMRITKQAKSDLVDLHVVVLEDRIVLLTKQDERLMLKAYNIAVTGKIALPIIRFQDEVMTRGNAAKKDGLFVIVSSTSYMYELYCSSEEERKSWLQQITKATDEYKSRQESRRLGNHASSSSISSGSSSSTLHAETESEDKSKTDENPTLSESMENTSASDNSLIISPKDTSPAPNSDGSTERNINSTPGDGNKLNAVGNGMTPNKSNATSSNSSQRKHGDFRRVVEVSSLIPPSEVTVENRDVQFALPVLSPHEVPSVKVKQSVKGPHKPKPMSADLIMNTNASEEVQHAKEDSDNANVVVESNLVKTNDDVASAWKEIKRLDKEICQKYEEKMRLASQILHIPMSGKEELSGDDDSTDPKPADAKILVGVCLQKVDKLGKFLSGQNITSENYNELKQQTNIEKTLTRLLHQVMSEIIRKDENEELRRQEIHRLREQNHGYLEKLKAYSKNECISPRSGETCSRTVEGASHSHPDENLIFGNSDDPALEEQVEGLMMEDPSKKKSSEPALTYNDNNIKTNSECALECEPLKNNEVKPSICCDRSQSSSSCDLAQEEFADAVEDLEKFTEAIEGRPAASLDSIEKKKEKNKEPRVEDGHGDNGEQNGGMNLDLSEVEKKSCDQNNMNSQREQKENAC